MRITRKRARPVKETQMVSLADIAFLIIFFFLLSSGFMRDKVNLPKLPAAAQTRSAVTVSMDADSHIELDGRPVDSPATLESLLRDRLAGKTKAEECEVRFKCDRDQKYKAYHPIFEAIANAGGVISIIHDVK